MQDEPFILHTATCKEAIERMNAQGGALTLFVVDESQRLLGTLADGDIRRGLLKNKSIQEPLSSFMHSQFTALQQGNFSLRDLVAIREKQHIKLLPILDSFGKVVKIVDFTREKSLLPIQAVLMAGGKGERLHPLTLETPKPLLPVGEKPMLWHSYHLLKSYNVDSIKAIVNYKAGLFHEFKEKHAVHELELIHEGDAFLGTFGGLRCLRKENSPYTLVMNADLLTNIDLEDFLLFFQAEKADFCMATITYPLSIPYSVVSTEGFVVHSLVEKPTLHHKINAGIYLFKTELIEQIEENTVLNAPDFIQSLIQKQHKVCAYPFTGYWLDIGRHEDYQKAQVDYKHL